MLNEELLTLNEELLNSYYLIGHLYVKYPCDIKNSRFIHDRWPDAWKKFWRQVPGRKVLKAWPPNSAQ